jgi:hypothetical protein
MGYTNDTAMIQFIPPTTFMFTAGTWTPTIASDVVSNVRTAGATSFTALIPLMVPGNSAYRKGSQIKSVDIWYTIATADLTDFATVSLENVALPANTVAPTGAAITGITLDSLHNTAALRKVQGSHKMNVSFDTPIWVNNIQALYIQLILNCAASSVVTLYGANINYVERN